ncbi:MAG: TRAP transporter small permease subunit [Candidatus Competibacterales bacterium]
MKTLLSASRFLDRVVSGIGLGAAWLTVPLMLIIVVDVTKRKWQEIVDFFYGLVGAEPSSAVLAFANDYLPASTKLQEMEWHLHGVIFMLCFGMAYLADSHVRVELLRDRLYPKVRAWIEVLGVTLCLIPFCLVVMYYGADFTYRSFATNEVSSALTGLPYRWIIKAMVPLGMLLLLVAGIAVLLRSLVYLFGPSELKSATASHVGDSASHVPRRPTDAVEP